MVKFKTEDDKALKGAAEEVLAMFKQGKIKSTYFDMSQFSTEARDKSGHVCGTAHCLGGWMAVRLGQSGYGSPELDLSDEVAKSSYHLYYPSKNAAFHATKKDGMAALENFIAGHKDPWRKVELSQKAIRAYEKNNED